MKKNLLEKLWGEMGLNIRYLNSLSNLSKEIKRFKQRLEKTTSEKKSELLKEKADIVKQEHKDSVRKRKIIRKNKKQSIDYQVISDDSESK
jgi:hypothetical protein